MQKFFTLRALLHREPRGEPNRQALRVSVFQKSKIVLQKIFNLGLVQKRKRKRLQFCNNPPILRQNGLNLFLRNERQFFFKVPRSFPRTSNIGSGNNGRGLALDSVNGRLLKQLRSGK